MNYSDATTPQVSKLGKVSLILAVVIFLFVGLTLPLFFIVGKGLPGEVLLGVLVIWLLAPLGHFVGLVLGIVSQFRSIRRDWLGIVGIALNLILGLLGVGLLALFGWALSQTLGAFT